MKYLPVFNWMIKWSLLAVLLAGAGGVYLWKNSDSLIEAQLRRKFEELAPDLILEFARTELDGTQSLTLHDVVIQERSSKRPIFRAKQLQLDVDSGQLLDHQRLVMDQVTIRNPDLLLIRQSDGSWNWQKYRFVPPKVRGVLPSVVIQDARIQLTLNHSEGLPSARLMLACPTAQAIPDSADSYDFNAAIDLPGAGELKVTGLADLESHTWKIGGQLKDVSADQRLMELATSANPALRTRLADLDAIISAKLPSAETRTAQLSGAALQLGNDSRRSPQFMGALDIAFEASSDGTSAIPDFRLRVNIRDGRIALASLPFAINQVQARFYKDNQKLEFQLEQARVSEGTVSGRLMIPANNPMATEASFLVDRFPINGQMRPLLPAKVQSVFDSYEPEGSLSVSGRMIHLPNGKWKPSDVVATLHETEVSYEKFQYPTTISGTLVQRDATTEVAALDASNLSNEEMILDVQLDGQFEDHPFIVNGWWKNPGERAAMQLKLDVADFPLDSQFRNALLPEQQKLVDSLNLTGQATGSVVFVRQPGLNQPTHPFATAVVSNGSINFSKFPYEIKDLTGEIKYDGPAKHWTFHQLKGRHGEARITGEGTFRGQPAPGVLQLQVAVQKAAIDADLYNALSGQQRKIWSMLNPSGFCDLTTDIHWTALPGQPAIVQFPRDRPVRIYDTRIKADAFPYELQIQEATVSFDPNDARKAGAQRCEIHSFKAFHGDSPVSASGWFEAKPNQEWQLHLSDLYARRLKPDNEFRSAMPQSWQESLARLQNQGTISIMDSELDFRGDIEGIKNQTACWNMNLQFNDCTVNAGLDISEIDGQVTAFGVWDGFNLENSGQIQLDTAALLEMPITNIRGPYTVNDDELVLGARRRFERKQDPGGVPRDQRINANAYGGDLLLDAVVDLSEQGRYQFLTELSNARLESYAALHIPDQANLRGIVTAWMSLSGYGEDAQNVTGKGTLRISPAALYELPVMFKVLGALARGNPSVQNLTAFTYALVQFDVGDQRFKLNRIDLVGEEVSFRGQGDVGFGGAVALNFYSQPPRRRGLSIPFINDLFTSWTKVEVRGTTSRPQTEVKALGQLDENMMQFLQPFNPRPNGPIPALQAPRLFPMQPLSPRLPRRIDPTRLRFLQSAR